MATKNLLKERIQLYKKFIKEGKVAADGLYKQDIVKTEKLLAMIETGKLTAIKFEALGSRDKWDIFWSKLIKGVTWHCKNCMCKSTVDSPFIGELYCENCDYLLSARTNGGQSNPFNWTFKKNKK